MLSSHFLLVQPTTRTHRHESLYRIYVNRNVRQRKSERYRKTQRPPKRKSLIKFNFLKDLLVFGRQPLSQKAHHQPTLPPLLPPVRPSIRLSFLPSFLSSKSRSHIALANLYRIMLLQKITLNLWSFRLPPLLTELEASTPLIPSAGGWTQVSSMIGKHSELHL